MRYFLVLLVLPLIVGLVAWAQSDTGAALEVVVVQSLDVGTAGAVLPIFEAELAARLRRMAEVALAPDFVAVPFTLPETADTAALLARVGAAAVEAASLEPPIDAFWLALDSAAPLELLVRVIEARTGRPVVYAASEAAVAAGALMSLAPEQRRTARAAASLAERLLDGAMRADVPVRAPYRVALSLNLETAAALGIVPRHELMQLARGRLYR